MQTGNAKKSSEKRTPGRDTSAPSPPGPRLDQIAPFARNALAPPGRMASLANADSGIRQLPSPLPQRPGPALIRAAKRPHP